MEGGLTSSFQSDVSVGALDGDLVGERRFLTLGARKDIQRLRETHRVASSAYLKVKTKS